MKWNIYEIENMHINVNMLLAYRELKYQDLALK